MSLNGRTLINTHSAMDPQFRGASEVFCGFAESLALFGVPLGLSKAPFLFLEAFDGDSAALLGVPDCCEARSMSLTNCAVTSSSSERKWEGFSWQNESITVSISSACIVIGSCSIGAEGASI